MHEEVLNWMIANTCHNVGAGEYGVRVFTFDLHCQSVDVVARFVGNWEAGDVRYEIVSWSAKEV